MATTPEEVYEFVKQFIESVGIDPATCWNDKNKAYYFEQGSAKIEVFISSHKMKSGNTRKYLRIFSALIKVPSSNKEKFYRRCLEISDQSLGVKISVVPNANHDNDWVYATYERDIEGIDYKETATCITDLGLWADWLGDKLQSEFGKDVKKEKPSTLY